MCVPYARATHVPGVKISIPTAGPFPTARSVSGIVFSFNLSGTDLQVAIGASASGSLLSLLPGEADGFLQSILGNVPTGVELSGKITWSSNTGAALDGLPGTTFVIPINQRIATVELKTAVVTFTSVPGGFAATAGFSGDGSLGPLSVAVKNVGLTLELLTVGPNYELEVLFKPPDGLGASLDVGPITGGGFLDIDTPNGRYAGILQLGVFGISVTAIALIDTHLPGGAKGFSFLVIITGEFPPIQLSFGFTLNGLGGIFGIERTMVIDALRDAVLHHSLDHILFAHDPIAHANEIISDLRAIFPPAQDEFVFGPMAKLGWGTPTLVDAELGIVLSLPRGVFALLGSLNAYIPIKEVPVVELHIDIAGLLDPVQKTLEFFASLHDSRVAQYTMYGDAAFVLTWGDAPSFLFSLGGFNPHFQPPPGFPALQRLTVELGFGSNPRISMQNYIAVTSNTLQFGAKAELYAAAGPFNVHGWIGFDALLILSPFSFIVDFSAGIEFRHRTDVLASVHLDATLSGPRPWHAWGEASISLFLFDASVHFDATVGDATPAAVPAIDPGPPLLAAIADPHNWNAEPPPNYLQVVTLTPPDADKTALLFDPVGGITLRERVLPLDETITKFAETKLAAPTKFTIDNVTIGGVPASNLTPVSEPFPRAQFEEMTDQQKLSLPSFEPMHAGFTIASAAAKSGDVQRDTLEYITEYFDAPGAVRPGEIYQLTSEMQRAMSYTSASARAAVRADGMQKYSRGALEKSDVVLSDETYLIVSTDDLKSEPGALPTPVGKGAAARALTDFVMANPERLGQLQIIASREALSR
jgi:Family of unknown function (DUF6603)